MAGINDEKLKMMEDEMNRFEEEIGLPVPPPPPLPPPFLAGAPSNRMVIGTNTYNQVQNQLDAMPSGLPSGPPLDPMPPMRSMPAVSNMFIPNQVARGPQMNPGLHGSHVPPNFGPGPPPLFPPPAGPMGFPPNFSDGRPMMPTLNQRPNLPMMPGMNSSLGQGSVDMASGPMMSPQGFIGGPPGFFPPPPPAFVKTQIEEKKVPVILSATPKLYNAKSDEHDKKDSRDRQNVGPVIIPSQIMKGDTTDISKKLAKKAAKNTAKEMAEAVKASQTVFVSQSNIETTSNSASNSGTNVFNKKKEKEKKSKKVIRTAGGSTWEDNTLVDWPDDDFRLFCGDLGNDVTDEVLIRAFSKYPSFQRARVVRDKRTNKTKGFGFVSFADPQDFIKATKEMNGHYVGSRPIKLRKSTWKNRNLDIVRKKDKEKQALIGLLTGH